METSQESFKKWKSSQDKKQVVKGSRVKLISTNDPFTDMKNNVYVGMVEDIKLVNFPNDSFTQIWVKWDNGSLFAIVPETSDQYEVLS
jgi:hypothetical protein